MASTYLTRTPSSNGNRRIWTFSAWAKLTGDAQGVLMGAAADTSNFTRIQFWGSGDGNRLTVSNRFSGTAKDVTPSRSFRDFSGWYHIVTAVDTTQVTASNRVKIWINGVQETDFQTEDYPDQDSDPYFNNTGYAMVLGNNPAYSHYYNGLMSHVNFVDGTAYQASDFGDTDATTGEWKINTAPSVTYGTNGFFLLKDGNSVTDQSGEGNNFTVGGGTLTATEDCPSNVFATLSPNLLKSSNGTISNGNLKLSVSGAEWNSQISTFGVSKGKFYFEYRINDNGGDRRARWGMVKESVIMNTVAGQVLCSANLPSINFKTNGESSTYGGYGINTTESNLVSDGDINSDNAVYGFGIDMDNLKMYGSYNGTWLNSGNPSTGTNGIDISSYITAGTTVFPAFTAHNSNVECNFGNGYFGTTAITSEGVNAAGIGKFEYDVPTGFTALSTKGLNE